MPNTRNPGCLYYHELYAPNSARTKSVGRMRASCIVRGKPVCLARDLVGDSLRCRGQHRCSIRPCPEILRVNRVELASRADGRNRA